MAFKSRKEVSTQKKISRTTLWRLTKDDPKIEKRKLLNEAAQDRIDELCEGRDKDSQ